MYRYIAILAAGLLFLSSGKASADLLALEVDGQAGFTQLGAIRNPDTQEMDTLSGGVVGVRGSLKILFLTLVVDYQHFLNNADMLHAGLGAGLTLPLGVVEPYLRGSAGLVALVAEGSAFDPKAQGKLEATAGFMARARLGLDIPLGGWFAVGAAAEVGLHYITEEVGHNFSVVGYLGLRI